ncbi:hypothetical protein ACFL4P_02795, partial [Gemmatimonadota bacterium]
PILFDSRDAKYIPTPLQGASRYSVETEQGNEELYRRLTDQPYAKKPKLGKLKALPKREVKQDFFETDKIFLAKLPTTNPELFGREKELKILNKAWKDSRTCILSLKAWGGVGKTALVKSWLNKMQKDNYRGAEMVYGWSFYSQGTREDRQASADPFFEHALKWFGDPDPKEGLPRDKGERLAGLVNEHRTLLILDGLEPLQYPPGEMGGRLRDQGMQVLLKSLARSNKGLCLITTRVKVEDIKDVASPCVRNENLDHLSKEAGAALLKSLGVKGTAAEYQTTSEEFKGHALALNLLGRFLDMAHKGDIRKRDLVPELTVEEEEGGHARRVMESYEVWLSGQPELDILSIMGLFDRPADGGAIEVLRQEPPIDGLTTELQGLSEPGWKQAVAHLKELRLLEPLDEKNQDTLDCHPLVREHFAERLRGEAPEAWKQAHSRLYEYYRDLQKKKQPDTLEEMQPLFAAVAHGCLAGRHQESLDQVFNPRIARDNEAYCAHVLGAFGAVLSAISGFFEVPWSKPSSGLKDSDKSWVLSVAGFCLRALGRLREAAQPIKAGLKARIGLKDWENAAIAASNLSELYLAIGDLAQAVEYLRQSVEYADRSEDEFQRLGKRAGLAAALHQAGRLNEAEALFIEAEALQKKLQPQYPILYSLTGFYFCDLLLGQGKYKEVQERACQTRKIALENKWLLDIGLDTLSLGRACLLKAQEEKNGAFSKATEYLEEAVDGLRKAGTQHHLPRGLLARAALRRVKREFSEAWKDLEETRELAGLGSMGLHLADYNLEATRLCLAQREKKEAREHLQTAGEMVEKMGYHRRDQELLAMEQELKG